MDSILIEVGLGLILVPWISWVTTSIFGHRQEIALIKQTHTEIRDSMKQMVKIMQMQNKKH